MDHVTENLVEVREYRGKGYSPVIDFESWRVAVLRWDESTQAEAIDRLERHDETDEVFVLLNGRCMLIIGDENGRELALYGMNMQPLKMYNVKQGCWHACILSQDADVLIIENKDTTLANSPRKLLETHHRSQIVALAQAFRD